MIRTTRYRLYNVAAHTTTPPSLPPASSEEVSPTQDPSSSPLRDSSISTPDSDVDRCARLRSGD